MHVFTAAAAPLGAGWLGAAEEPERARLLEQARATDAARQLQRCCPGWAGLFEHLSWRAITRLARNETVDPNDPTSWRARESHAQVVLRRHGITRPPASRLTIHAQQELIDTQAAADHGAGLDWTTLPAPGLDERMRPTHAALPISLDDPTVFAFREDQRRALCGRLELAPGQADDLSRWVLDQPGEFHAADLRCWRIGSATWLALADQQQQPVKQVERPVGVFVVPAGRDGWQLIPVLSLDAIRLISELGGRLDRDLCAATLPTGATAELLERINIHALHAGPKECLDTAGKLAHALTRALDTAVNPGVPCDKRDRWGRLLVTRRTHTTNGGEERAELRLRVVTFPARGFGRRRLGAAPFDHRAAAASAVMELGEAVQTAIERELPLLLSTEAAGLLKDTVRVGRMKGRPGVVTITTADGVSATTRRVVAEQAIAELRALKQAGARVTLDAGARQVVRMTLARPLADDPILLGRQREMAALKVVGSGVDASATGTGKCFAADTRVLVNGDTVTAATLWDHHSGSRQEFDGEGFWATPSQPLTTNSLAHDGRIVTARITRLYRQRVSERGRRITLDDGSTITVTNAHQLHGVDCWTRELSQGDFVCVPARACWDGRPLDHGLVELVAWQIAEGYETSYVPGPGARARKRSDSARITQRDEAVLARLRTIAEGLSRREGVALGAMAITRAPGRASTLCINSRAWRRYLESKLDYRWGVLSADKQIPPRIMASDDGSVAVFLRAFFDAEASVAKPNRGIVEITSASRELIDQLSLMLRRFRVWLRIKRKTKAATNGSGIARDYWTGYIGGPSLRRFAEHIGFGDPAKGARLAENCSAASNTNVEGVPVADLVATVKAAGATRNTLHPAGRVGGATVGTQRATAIVEGYARAVLKVIAPHLHISDDPRVRAALQQLDADAVWQAASKLHDRLRRNVFYARVVSVEEVELDGWVYDLEVAQHHNFVAGGMLAHNTISTGRALAHRAATTRRLRAMVVAEGRLLGQWRDELTCGAPGRGLPPLAPNVEVTIIGDQQSVAGQLRAFDRELGDGAGVALVPNGLLDRYPGELQTIRWHLLVADEALRYVNPATEAHQALAQVRFGAAADCWLLTATPRGKTAEHLDVLVGLAVGDEAMIRERLNTREAGDLMDEIHAHRLRVNYGPHLVRVTRKDMQAWMPRVRPAEPLALEPDPALGELLDAIRTGGREAYRRLLAVLRELKTLEPGGALHKQALTELSRAQGVVLGNVGTYVDASVDPETLLHSKGSLATALARQGLVAEAMRGGGDGLPLLRGITAQTIDGVAREEQVIVFAERVRCLRQLAATLRERHGVEAHVGDGSIPRAEFEALKQRFGAGEFPVLCLSQVGHEGHNLQTASCLVHLDVPWLQTGLEQRVGRAARPGSARGWVQTYIPYIKGGGIEHVVSVLAGRAAEHHQILDSFEGVNAADSTVATQLGQITSQVAAAKSDAGFAATAARLRVAAGVFGAQS